MLPKLLKYSTPSNCVSLRLPLVFDVLLTVHLSIFISVFNQLDAQNLFHNKFYFMPLHVSSTCAHHHEVKIALHSLWYHHTYRCDTEIKILFSLFRHSFPFHSTLTHTLLHFGAQPTLLQKQMFITLSHLSWRRRSWLRQCSTNREVAGSIHDGFTTLGSTHLLT